MGDQCMKRIQEGRGSLILEAIYDPVPWEIMGHSNDQLAKVP